MKNRRPLLCVISDTDHTTALPRSVRKGYAFPQALIILEAMPPAAEA